MPIEHRWTRNGDVRIHYVECGRAGDGGLPLLFVPGVSDTAEEYDDVLAFFAPRRALAVDVRGRGQSDAPPAGYTFEELTADVAAVVAAAGLERFHLVTFSRGTTPALGLMCRFPAAVASLSIGDYRAEQIALPTTWPGMHNAGRWRGRPNAERMPAHVAHRLQEEGVAMDFFDDLARWGGPLLVARGTKEGGLVSDAVVARYRAARPAAEIVTFPESNHDIFRPDRLQYPRAVAAFIARNE